MKLFYFGFTVGFRGVIRFRMPPVVPETAVPRTNDVFCVAERDDIVLFLKKLYNQKMNVYSYSL